MNRIMISITLLILVCSHTSITKAQRGITENDIDVLQITPIRKSIGQIDARTGTTEKAIIRNQEMINSDGSIVLLKDRMVRNIGQSSQSYNLPDTFLTPQFSTNIDQLYYWSERTEYQQTLHYYNIEQRETIGTFSFESIPGNGRFRSVVMSDDGSTIAIEKGKNLHLYTYNTEENKYIPTKELEPRSSFPNIMVSKYGNRVFFWYWDGNNWGSQYVERTVGGWSDIQTIPIPAMKTPDRELPREVVAIADEGKTVIVKTSSLLINKNEIVTKKKYISVIYEKDGIWSEPEPVGEFTLPVDPEGAVYFAEIAVSDDGQVIAVQQPKDVYDGNVFSYDLFVFIQNNSGNWIKQQVNSRLVHVIGNVLLSGDGSKLLWTPRLTLSAPFSEQYK